MDDVNKEKHISYEKERYCRKRLLYLLRYGAAKEGLPVSKRGKIIFWTLANIFVKFKNKNQEGKEVCCSVKLLTYLNDGWGCRQLYQDRELSFCKI